MLRAISVVGTKKTGKTTTCVELITELKKRGLRVGAVKSAHHSFDFPERDTDKMFKQADIVAGLSPEQTMVLWPGNRGLAEAVSLMDVDVVVVEGAKSQEALPRVVLTEDSDQWKELGRDLGLGSMGGQPVQGVPHITSIQELADLVLDKGFFLPMMDCAKCGYEDCAALARAIVQGKESVSQCQKAAGGHISVKVAGRELGMNDFVRKMIGSTIRGMLSELKGYEPGPIKIEISDR